MSAFHQCLATLWPFKVAKELTIQEAAAVTVGSSAFGNITLKPTRFAGAVDISKHLMYSQNGQLDDLFGRDSGNAIASCFDKHVLDIVVARLRPMAVWLWEHRPQQETAAATDFGDVGALVGKYLAGNPDSISSGLSSCTLTCMGISLAKTADAGGNIQAANFQEQLKGRPAFITTNMNDETVLSSAAFGDADANDTISVSPIICADASDIFMCTWAGISINVDVYTEALKGVVRSLMLTWMATFCRPGSAAFLEAWQVDTAYTAVS